MSKETTIRLSHLQRLPFIGNRRILKFLQFDKQLSSLYQLSTQDVKQLFQLSSTQANVVLSNLHSSRIRNMVEQDVIKYSVLTILDDNYPYMLKVTPDPPALLYTKGNLEILQTEPKISVIGTRNFSSEARKKVDFFVRAIVEKNWVIVSGMARGIDTMAHETANRFAGKTIAVLGFGFDYVYPQENRSLMNLLGSKHLIISEYPPQTPPSKWHFPARNRIISGLSFGCLIIEAKEKSGTFITAEQALEQGREVFVVPGSIFTEQSIGCHVLIQEGAELVYHPESLFYAWEKRKKQWIC